MEFSLERLGTSKKETLIVGDRLETDIASGQAAGCPTAVGVERRLDTGTGRDVETVTDHHCGESGGVWLDKNWRCLNKATLWDGVCYFMVLSLSSALELASPSAQRFVAVGVG